MEPLIGKTTEELGVLCQELGQPAYRGKQIAAWIYRSTAETIGEMTDLSREIRARLENDWTVGLPTIPHRDSAPDGTIKYLMEMPDGERVETVYLPYPDRVSVCLLSQVGCPAGCTFCATAQGGLARNLTAGEIVGQLLRVQRDSARRVSHAVYMGMGEPLLNYDAVVKSVRLLGGEVGMSFRNLTLSTVGVAPAIRALAKENLPITLALSLHAPEDSLRARLIPTARKWSLDEILDACAEYAGATGRNLTFEYLMLGGLNDSPEQARALAAILKKRRLPGNVNLIPFNYVETPEGFRRPQRESVAQFRQALEDAGRVTTQRMTRGHAISAACGQLRRTTARDISLPLIPLSAV